MFLLLKNAFRNAHNLAEFLEFHRAVMYVENFAGFRDLIWNNQDWTLFSLKAQHTSLIASYEENRIE